MAFNNKKKNANYISAKESRAIARENRKITQEIEKKRNRKHIPEEEYVTKMKNPENCVEFDNVQTYFFTDIGTVKSVDGVSFDVPQGKTVGIVGESGCGKSVTSLSLMQLVQRPSGQTVGGEIRFNTGDHVYNVVNTPTSVMQKLRGNYMSMIFQEPMTSLNPVLRIGEQVDEVIALHNPDMTKDDVKTRTIQMLEMVGIANKEGVYRMYPHELSGGMRQRIMIAMALACNPRLIIADEPTTALDVTIQAQIINLLRDLQKERGLTYLFISHDLSVVEHISDTVGVMYLGGMVESGETADIFGNPLHPYTKALFSAIPMPDPDVRKERILLKGDIPSPANPPAGCKFHTRCSECMEICKHEEPQVKDVGNGHKVKCHLYDEK